MNAVYAGTFDPVTSGHLDIIERASKMYDILYVTIFVNPQKTTLFSLKERLELLKEVTSFFDNVRVDFSQDLAEPQWILNMNYRWLFLINIWMIV